MKTCSVVLLLFVSLAAALTEVQYQDAFTGWMREHSKSYTSRDFFNKYNIFKKNLDFIHEWNAKNRSTVLGATVFADLTNEEYKRVYLGTRFDGSARLASTVLRSTSPTTTAAPLPASMDWVTEGAVTPIKNQGDCGSCWSFSTTGSVEGAHYLSTKNLVSLSEQNLMDCSASYGNEGCNGGLMTNSFQYIIANKGIDTEASYPYTMTSEACHYSATNRGATISAYKEIPAGSETGLQAIAALQPVSVAIDASHQSFQLYRTGVYNEPACSSSSLDHGVLVVGYGNAPDGTAYWLVKNSWGVTWGQAGYIWMSRNVDNQCGIATMASYPIV